MTSQRPSNEKTTISPILLKNFNTFETLEPQKVPTCGPPVEKLIDIDDDSKPIPNSNTTGSLYDPATSYNLVDLFQNIFVTPQHVTKTETYDIDFKDFLDEIEAKGSKIANLEDKTDLVGRNKSKEHEESPKINSRMAASDLFAERVYFDMNMTQVPKISMERDPSSFHMHGNVLSTNHEPSQDCYNGVNYDLYVKPRVIVPTIDIDSDSDPEDLIDKIISNKNIERNLSQIENTKMDTQHSYDTEPVNSEPEVNSKRTTEVNTQVPLNSQKHNSTNDRFDVKAMVKDEKVYKKSRIVKPDFVKANYTKGPDYYEKTVVLPQIMKRLIERQRVLDDEKNWQRRLIFDAGSVKPTNTNCSCSKANFVASGITTAAAKLPNTESINRMSSGPSWSNHLLESRPKSIPNPVTTQSTLADSHLRISTGNPAHNHQNLNSLESQVARHNFKDTPSAQGRTSTSTEELLSGFSPVLLMEDCNRERLLAWKQSKFISQLVRTGKYP